MLKVGIVGGTGYTGLELIRLVALHPQAELQVITSRSEAGSRVADLFPSLRGVVEIEFSDVSVAVLSQCDLVFFATPNGVAMSMVPELLANGVKVIDLAADFRLKSADVWAEWYGLPHACPQLLKKAVYGLPELHREKIAVANLVANPGCYPTSITLGLAPLLAHKIINCEDIIADAKSGVSGAGRKASVDHLMCETSESFKAYGVQGHRHHPEISQSLKMLANNRAVGLTFVPHLVPMIRGIHSTIYATSKVDRVDLQGLFEEYYRGEHFVDVLPQGSHPATRDIKNSNMCKLAVHQLPGTNRIVILSVIDNLVKGAAGQAIQNMNIMFDLDEAAGLSSVASVP